MQDKLMLPGENSHHFRSHGKQFQEKIFQCLINDHRWATQMIEVMEPGFFDVRYLTYLTSKYFNYFEKYKCFPTMSLLVNVVREDLSDGNDLILRDQIVEFLHRMKSNPNPGDLHYVKDKSLDFCKRQAFKEALEKSVELIQTDKFESVIDLMKNAVAVGMPSSIGHDFFEDIEARFVASRRRVCPTGISKLDSEEILQGGLGRGELGVVTANTGVGKSHFLVQMGANALKAGKCIVHYTFELTEHAVGLRYDSNLCDIPSNEVPGHKSKVIERYKDNDLGKLIIKEFPTGSASVITLRNHIEKISMKGFVPSVVIIDYADVMRATRSYDSLRHELKLVYEELRNLAMDLNVPVWTACFHGDTVISSPIGKFKIRDMVGKCNFPVFSYDHEQGKIVCKTVKSVYKSGEGQELWKVTLDNGNEVIVTPNHKFMRRNGEYEELRNLKIGDSLMPFNRRIRDNRKQIYLNNGKWENQCKIVAEWKFGEIPKYHQVHHIDMNKFNDHPDNLEVLTISEHYRVHGKESWNKDNPGGIEHLREVYLERMKSNNPMFNPKTREKMAQSRKGKCMGDDNPMKLDENRKRVSDALENSQAFSDYIKAVPEKMRKVWKDRPDEQPNKMVTKSEISKWGSSRDDRIIQHQELALLCQTYKEFIKKAKHIPLRSSNKRQVWKNKNHKIVKIEFYGHDDVYNMEVEDLHNYALDAGIVVKNSQANRDSANSDIVGLENMSEAYGKAMVADFVVSLSRKATEKADGSGRLFIAKNRAGKDGLVFPIHIDTALSKIEILDGDHMTLNEAVRQDDNAMKSLLKQKWKEMNGKED